jgi:hypothetical protein
MDQEYKARRYKDADVGLTLRHELLLPDALEAVVEHVHVLVQEVHGLVDVVRRGQQQLLCDHAGRVLLQQQAVVEQGHLGVVPRRNELVGAPLQLRHVVHRVHRAHAVGVPGEDVLQGEVLAHGEDVLRGLDVRVHARLREFLRVLRLWVREVGAAAVPTPTGSARASTTRAAALAPQASARGGTGSSGGRTALCLRFDRCVLILRQGGLTVRARFLDSLHLFLVITSSGTV